MSAINVKSPSAPSTMGLKTISMNQSQNVICLSFGCPLPEASNRGGEDCSEELALTPPRDASQLTSHV